MKNESEIKALVLTVVSTLAEVGPRGLPSSELYAGLMNHCNLTEYNGIIGLLVASDLLTQKGFLLHPTDKCKETAKKIEAILKS